MARLQNVMTKEGNTATFETMFEKLKDDIFKDLKVENIEYSLDFS